MKFLLLTLGCKVNTYESDALRELFLKANYFEAKKDETPDVIVINTCSVTHVASKKSRQIIRKYRKLYKDAILILMGCFVQEEQLNIFDVSEAEIILGTTHRREIINYLEKYLKTKEKIIALEKKPFTFKYEEIATLAHPLTTRAFVKIQDGCDNYCSYCLIPHLRGRSRSRKEADILHEIKTLVANGYKEIVLVGINLGVYGLDLENSSLTKLIKNILKEAPSLYLLRLSSIESWTISDELISLLASEMRLAKHLHIPLQSGSEVILEKMHRRSSKEEYRELIQKIKNKIPRIAITTDVIVGFPSESEEYFQETFDFIEEMNFSAMHVFPFSKRAKTPAALMDQQVDEEIKKERVRKLLSLNEVLEKKYQGMFNNEKLSVLFETYDEKKQVLKGHTSNYLLIEMNCAFDLRGEVHEIIYFSNNEIKLVVEKNN